MNKLRWGILGTARIARKNWNAIHQSGSSVVTAVASRDAERSRQFVAECQCQSPFGAAPAAFGSYEELLAARDVDAVYIPLPTGLHKEWVIRAAEAGKHVLCEKPCAASVADVREMIEACRRKRVQFMDGVMFMHNPRLNRIREVLDDGVSIGRIKRITSQFSFSAEEDFLLANIRADSALEPLGSLGDLGWYCIRFALWAMNWQLPREVSGRVLSEFSGPRSPSPVPADFSGELLFDGGAAAGFYCSFLATFRQWAEVSGMKGHLRVPDFVVPSSDSEFAFEVNDVKLADNARIPATAQAANMFRNFASQVFSGNLNDAWPEMALKTQQALNACLDAARGKRAV